MIAASIDRTSLTLSALALPGLPDANGYVCQRVGRPSIMIDRAMAESPWVNGAYQVSARKVQTSLPLSVWVYADDNATFHTRMNALQAAAQQWAFTVSTIIAGATAVWSGNMADFSLSNEEWAGPYLAAKWQLVNIDIPVFPVSA